MPSVLLTFILGLLAEAPVARAVAGGSGSDTGSLHVRGEPSQAHARHKSIHANLKLATRQDSTPLYTTDPDCTIYDGYFYVTPANYTWQLQCAFTYQGIILEETTDTTDIGSCINECVAYNRQNGAGACVAVTFNGPFGGGQTTCSQFSSIDPTLTYPASEEGGVENSALLILGPGGYIFATPEADPTFSGAPTQPPVTVDPVPSQTTTPTAFITTSMSLSTSNTPSVITLFTDLTTTTTSTSTSLVTICTGAPEACQPNSSSTSLGTGSNTQGGNGSPASSSTSLPYINISNGGSKPISTTPAGAVPRSTTSGAFTFDAGQQTFTNVVPFTEYRVQTIEICAATPTPCSQSISTATDVIYRTEISCSPGACIGVVPATGYLVDAIDAMATATCVVAS